MIRHQLKAFLTEDLPRAVVVGIIVGVMVWLVLSAKASGAETVADLSGNAAPQADLAGNAALSPWAPLRIPPPSPAPAPVLAPAHSYAAPSCSGGQCSAPQSYTRPRLFGRRR